MAGRYTGTLPAYSIMSTGGLGGGMSRQDLIIKQKEREELERQRRARILAGGPARSSGAVDPRLTIEINEGVPRFTPQPGKGGLPVPVARPMSPEYARSQQFGIGKGGAPVRMPGRPALSNRYQQAGRGGAPGMAKGERDPFLTDDDLAFLMAVMDPLINRPSPHTPYGFASGGPSRDFASLPFLMRGYS